MTVLWVQELLKLHHYIMRFLIIIFHGGSLRKMLHPAFRRCSPLDSWSTGNVCIHLLVHYQWSTAVAQLMDTNTSDDLHIISSLNSTIKYTKRLQFVSYYIELIRSGNKHDYFSMRQIRQNAKTKETQKKRRKMGRKIWFDKRKTFQSFRHEQDFNLSKHC